MGNYIMINHDKLPISRWFTWSAMGWPSRGTLVFGVPIPFGKLNGEGKDDLRRQGAQLRSTAKWPVSEFSYTEDHRSMPALASTTVTTWKIIKHHKTTSNFWFLELGNMSTSFCIMILAFVPRIPQLSAAAVAWPATNLCDKPISTSWTTIFGKVEGYHGIPIEYQWSQWWICTVNRWNPFSKSNQKACPLTELLCPANHNIIVTAATYVVEISWISVKIHRISKFDVWWSKLNHFNFRPNFSK